MEKSLKSFGSQKTARLPVNDSAWEIASNGKRDRWRDLKETSQVREESGTFLVESLKEYLRGLVKGKAHPACSKSAHKGIDEKNSKKHQPLWLLSQRDPFQQYLLELSSGSFFHMESKPTLHTQFLLKLFPHLVDSMACSPVKILQQFLMLQHSQALHCFVFVYKTSHSRIVWVMNTWGVPTSLSSTLSVFLYVHLETP